MLKKLKLISCILAVVPVLLMGQENRIIRADGKVFKPNKTMNVDSREVQALFSDKAGRDDLFEDSDPDLKNRYDDILTWNVPPSVNFGFFGQDRMLQWFEAPADMIINAAGFNTATIDVPGAPASLKLVKINWNKQTLLDHWASHYWGYYQAAGNGFNDACAFMDDPDYTGPWVDTDPDGLGLGEPFLEDLWSDNGMGMPVIPVADGEYQWVDMNSLGYEPVVQAGDIVGIVMKNESTTMDADRIGFIADNTLGIPGWKYYANGRLDPPNDYGWWSREFTWDFVLGVTFTSDTPPTFNFITILTTTLSTDPRLVEANVTDANPAGGAAGVASVSLFYSINGDSFIEVPMSGSEPNYSAYIPAQDPCASYEYYLRAEDVNGNVSESDTYEYLIFCGGNTNLLVFNGFESPTGYPQDYYFGQDDFATFEPLDWPHDVWSYGPLTAELVDNYTNIFEICTTGPTDYNDDVIRNWLAANANANYFLAGQDWLGVRFGYTDMDFGPGTFEFDILGITHSFNDVSFDGTSGQELPSLVFPQEGSTLGGELFNLYNSQPTGGMYYDPIFENSLSNWIDAFETLGDVEIDLQVETRGIASAPAVEIKNSALHRILPGGNKIAFLAYDPISLNSYPEYYWYGFSATAPQVQTLLWFEALDFLPVELTSFSASVGEDNVILNWETATEENNSGFSIERSADNKIFSEIAFVDGNGTTTEKSTYSYIDINPQTGKNYYRLKQVNFDGTFERSQTIEVDFGVPEEFQLSQNYPNPFNPTTTIRFALPVDSKVTIQLYDLLGREVVKIVDSDYSAGRHHAEFDAGHLASGTYIYRINAVGIDGNTFVDVRKMILLR